MRRGDFSHKAGGFSSVLSEAISSCFYALSQQFAQTAQKPVIVFGHHHAEPYIFSGADHVPQKANHPHALRAVR